MNRHARSAAWVLPLLIVLLVALWDSAEPLSERPTSDRRALPLTVTTMPHENALVEVSRETEDLVAAFDKGQTIDVTLGGRAAQRFTFRKRQAVAEQFQLTLGSDPNNQLSTALHAYEGRPVSPHSRVVATSAVFINNALALVIREADGSVSYVRTNPETTLLESRREEPDDGKRACMIDLRGAYTIKGTGYTNGSDQPWRGGTTVKVSHTPVSLSGVDPSTGDLDKYINPIALASRYDASLRDAMLLLVLDKEATGSSSTTNLASKASQYLATISNVAAVYENQLGIRLLVQEMIMIPDSPSYTDIPTRDDLDDFLDWCDDYRPIRTYQWSIATKFGAGLSRDTLGVAYLDSVGSDSGVSLCVPDGAWDVIAHEIGHNLGSDHSQGGIMNATSNGGQERTFFTNVSRNETAAKDIYDYSRARLLGNATLRHPEQMPFAHNDSATTPTGAAIQVDVLTNDDTSVLNGQNNALSLTEISAITPSQAGIAEIIDDEILFTPTSGFEGTAWFS